MKTLLFLFAFQFLLFNQPAAAQTSSARVPNMTVQNYLHNLENENHGVVISSMLHLLAWVQRHPDASLDAVYGALARSMRHTDPTISDRAFLTLSAMVDKRILHAIPAIQEDNAATVYLGIAQMLNRSTIATR